MPRYRLTIEYDGTPFVGWQAQDNGVSVQGVLTDAVAAFTGERVTVNGAGRTDAGVHALGQVGPCRSRQRLGRRHRARRAQCSFAPATGRGAVGAARRRGFRRALLREASGIISTASSTAAPISRSNRDRAWRVPRPLDCGAMHAAAQRFVGRHDFTTFRSTECQAKSPVKTLDRLDVTRDGDEVRVTAVGALVPAASGALDGRLARPCRRRQMERRDLATALAARDRAACGQVAPPHGLYLVRVDYESRLRCPGPD